MSIKQKHVFFCNASNSSNFKNTVMENLLNLLCGKTRFKEQCLESKN